MRGSDNILRVSTADGAVRDYALSKPEMSLGRSPDNDILLQDPKVSGHHARVIVTGADVRIVDVGSSNGTCVNGQPILVNVPTPIRPGDVVQLGDTHISLRLPDRPREAVTSSAGATANAIDSWLGPPLFKVVYVFAYTTEKPRRRCRLPKLPNIRKKCYRVRRYV